MLNLRRIKVQCDKHQLMQQKVWERWIKPWKPGLFSFPSSSLVYILRAALRGGPLLFLLHLCMAETMRVSSADCRVEFFFLRPLLKGYLYMWLLTSSCPAQRLMMPGDSRPENWRVVKVLLAFCCSRTLCAILAFNYFTYSSFSLCFLGQQLLLLHGLHTCHLTLHRKPKWTSHRGQAQALTEGKATAIRAVVCRCVGALYLRRRYIVDRHASADSVIELETSTTTTTAVWQQD